MQFKRMAVVAAAAVAGQTLLMAAPAVAEDQPAVTVPDAVPADTAEAAGSPARAEAPAKAPPKEQAKEQAKDKTQAKDKAGEEVGEKAEGKAGGTGQAAESGVQEPAARAVAAAPEVPDVPAVPEAQAQPQTQALPEAAAEAAEAVEEDQDTGSDRMLMGPEVTVQGIPADGFKADGSWTALTVTVDNSGHVAVPGYTPMLGVSQAAGQFAPAHVKVEYRTAGGPWTAAVQDSASAPALGYALGGGAAVPSGEVQTIEVRISFAADTPVVPFDLTADGRSRVGTSTGTSPTSSYATRIAGAPGGDEDPLFTEGPALTVSGVPGSVRAGGDWTDLSVRVDNTGKGELAAFDLGLVLARPDFVSMQASQITVEVLRAGADGQAAAWQSVEITSDEDGYFFAGGLAGGPIAAGAAFDVPVRVRFSADAPTGSVSFFAWGTSQVDAETPPPWAGSRSKRQLTTLLEPATVPGGETPGGGTPGGETPGGETPGGSTPGSETPGGETPGGSTPGGETPGGETPGGSTPGGGTPGGETPGGGTPGGGTPGGETPGGETPGGGTPGSETPGGETPGGGTPGGETPGGETPGSETPGGETPGGSTPGGGTPGGETPGGGAPGGEIPGGSTPGGGTPGGGTPGGGTPGGGTPGSETPGGETPGGGAPGGEIPGGSTPGGGTPGGSTPGGGTPGGGTPGGGTPGGGTPGGNVPKPNGGTSTPGTGTGTSTGTGTTASGGGLAATGSDPATTWALGGAGTALVLGAALVAGTGRHRRRTTA
ncbi:hypothetical protein [Streptomyces sp. NBC_01408]|uniref:hypothetical protein n=1 Tax=Streptomyces sp. NBC_01408 TaxID=2903855 RepID=UPI00225A7166|nr:hypothetical protein [Streptomyces sp. NBC_01408]MCX4691759.1 hypothetical protein [Streptomyces sp. NBC_01408]